jgi:hypothetical protein
MTIAMPYSKKVVLSCPHGTTPGLDSLVEDFIRDGVIFVAVVGPDCSNIEDLIDWTVIGPDGTRDYHLLTSNHPGQSIDEAVAFARSLTGEFAGDEVQVVELKP